MTPYVFIKGSSWTVLNVALLFLITYIDHRYLWPDWALACLTVPVGLINCALLLVWIPRFFKGNRELKILAVFAFLNAIYCMLIFNQLYVLGGDMVNR